MISSEKAIKQHRIIGKLEWIFWNTKFSNIFSKFFYLLKIIRIDRLRHEYNDYCVFTWYDNSHDKTAVASGLLCVAANKVGRVNDDNLGSP